jgi:hypothetical protein
MLPLAVAPVIQQVLKCVLTCTRPLPLTSTMLPHRVCACDPVGLETHVHACIHTAYSSFKCQAATCSVRVNDYVMHVILNFLGDSQRLALSTPSTLAS